MEYFARTVILSRAWHVAHRYALSLPISVSIFVSALVFVSDIITFSVIVTVTVTVTIIIAVTAFTIEKKRKKKEEKYA